MEAAHKTQLAKGEVGIEQPKKIPTLRAFAEERFLLHVRTNFRAKPKTLEYYENGVKQILRYGELSRLKLDDIAVENIDQYVETRLSHGLAIGSVNRELQVLRRMFNLAVEWKTVREPLARVRLVPECVPILVGN